MKILNPSYTLDFCPWPSLSSSLDLPLLKDLQRLLHPCRSAYHWRPPEQGPSLPFSSSCFSFPQTAVRNQYILQGGFSHYLLCEPASSGKAREVSPGLIILCCAPVPFYHPDFLQQDSPPPLLQQILPSFISNTCLWTGLWENINLIFFLKKGITWKTHVIYNINQGRGKAQICKG